MKRVLLLLAVVGAVLLSFEGAASAQGVYFGVGPGYGGPRYYDPPPRYYVKLGSAYIAFGETNDPRGGSDPNQPPAIDHFCVLVKD